MEKHHPDRALYRPTSWGTSPASHGRTWTWKQENCGWGRGKPKGKSVPIVRIRERIISKDVGFFAKLRKHVLILLLLGTTVVLLISAVLIAHKLHLITRHFPFIVTNAPESQAISPPPARGSLAQPQVDPVHLLLQQAFQLLEQKQFDAALDKVNVALQAAPKNEDAYGLRGNIYAEKKLWDQAEKDYQTGLQIDGKNVQIKFNLAEIQFMQKKYDDARPGFAALEQNSNMGDLATYKVFLCDLGQNRIRTCEGKARRFTVFPRWPLGYLPENGARWTAVASLEAYASRRGMKMLFCGKSLRPRRSSPGGRHHRKGVEKSVSPNSARNRSRKVPTCFGGSGQREDRTAAAAHERVEDLGLFAEPGLRRRQPRIFREGGRLEIVAQREPGKSRPGCALPRILRVGFVGPRRRNAETGMDEQALVNFPPASPAR
jgi:hypothetical protein